MHTIWWVISLTNGIGKDILKIAILPHYAPVHSLLTTLIVSFVPMGGEKCLHGVPLQQLTTWFRYSRVQHVVISVLEGAARCEAFPDEEL